jgi:hypothetical protein
MSRAARRNKLVLAAIVVLIFGVANLFGRELNALMLRWPGIDKVLHFGAFALFFAVTYGLASTNLDPRRAALLVAGLGVAVSFSDEAVQAVTPGRNVELGDLMADWSGLGFGWSIAAAPTRRFAVPFACAALLAGASVSYASYASMHDISRARAHLREGNFLEARESLLKALAAGHRTAAVFNELAWADVESGRGEPEQAVRWARTALEMTPDDPNVLDTYGWASRWSVPTGPCQTCSASIIISAPSISRSAARPRPSIISGSSSACQRPAKRHPHAAHSRRCRPGDEQTNPWRLTQPATHAPPGHEQNDRRAAIRLDTRSNRPGRNF